MRAGSVVSPEPATAMIASFLVILAAFTLIGVASSRYARQERRDYLLAGQAVRPWLVGLSAVATNNSGYMFIGVIGYTYATGLAATWLMIGWIVGDLVASQIVHRKLRTITGERHENTFAGLLARWNGTDFRQFRRLGGLISVLFLGAYAAAQLVAGSKAISVLFGWDAWVGATIGAVIVTVYCLAGGIRASIWTDAAQSVVMIVAMSIMLAVCVNAIGGVDASVQALHAVSPTFMNWLPSGLQLGSVGPVLFIVGWMFAGFSVVGQPHIMVRFMALDDPKHTNRARLYYYLWFIAFYFLANSVGLLSRVLLPDAATFDAELALPTIAATLLPPMLVGLVLAGVFAATMSTADSLILSCSATITEDFTGGERAPVWVAKVATLLVTGFALAIALDGSQTVFSLVIVSWAVLGAAFGPLMTVYALGGRPSQALAIAMTVVGVGAVYVWKSIDLLGDYYEGMFAILLGFATYGVGARLGLTEERSWVGGDADAAAEPDRA
jgi:sodium/proline symporter